MISARVDVLLLPLSARNDAETGMWETKKTEWQYAGGGKNRQGDEGKRRKE